ncbi:MULTISPECIES: helix-turn-helix transcriptional regulator [Pseudomonas]|uniref:LuxR family transcriptional regulator n=1 Tax=Pseudomonas azadiae TaxID=2843612 RepID=A0ABS6NY92_9PSED|nr:MULTISPECIES: LuxR family transcriptional regulator [Pseudomonas]MBV4452777.1 LuxR family transcriptional regulator [Pseudomonas azadiae]NMF42404.1 LuxR family transcriptional regulator [Pseudomonas sp. SWRI 103]
MIRWINTQPLQHKDEDELTEVFERVITKTYELGFDYCCVKMSSNESRDNAHPTVLTNCPDEWEILYAKAEFFRIDPVVEYCQSNVLPLVWRKALFQYVPSLWTLARTLGVHNALTFSVHDPRGVISMLTLSRSKGAVTPEELYEKAGLALWLCHLIHDALARKHADRPHANPVSTLTARETEILKWSALGKTADEISQIIKITPRTVGFHVSSILRKLGVNNKIAAVLRASKMGLF